MTREEAKEYIQDMINEDDLDFHGEYLVDKIYDDFESRTCENCKHYMAEKMECKNNNSEASLSRHDIHDDFGCNKFERKQND